MITVYYDIGDKPHLEPMQLVLHPKRSGVFLIENEGVIDYSAAIHDVYMVHADSDELDYIRINFLGLRGVINRPTLRWTGGDAEFIVNNITIVRQGRMKIR